MYFSFNAYIGNFLQISYMISNIKIQVALTGIVIFIVPNC